MNRATLLCLCLALAVALALLAPKETMALERNFAGSAQLDYHAVPTQLKGQALPGGGDGFTAELALKLAVDVSDTSRRTSRSVTGAMASSWRWDISIIA